MRLCRPSRSLKRLRLGYWRKTPDLVLREVSAETALEVLELVCCPELTDATVERIIAGCKSLKRLVLIDNDSITYESLRAYLKSDRKIELEVRECPAIRVESRPEDLLLEEVSQCLKQEAV